MRRSVAIAAFSLLAAAAGCNSSTLMPVLGPVSVQVNRSTATLRLTNHTDRPVFTFVIGRVTAMLADWVPCADAERCPPIAPGATREVPAPQRTPSGEKEKEAIVYWWYAVATPGGGFAADSIRAIVVGL